MFEMAYAVFTTEATMGDHESILNRLEERNWIITFEQEFTNRFVRRDFFNTMSRCEVMVDIGDNRIRFCSRAEGAVEAMIADLSGLVFDASPTEETSIHMRKQS
jgi:hypothetical protein